MTARRIAGPKVRYAVVGGGWISQAAFMPGVAHTGNSEMTALVTGDPVKAEKLAAAYGLRSYGYDEYERLIESGEIDAIYLALPNWMHRDYAVPALEAGLPVLLEKPMATSEADCRAIMDAAARSGAKLMIAYRLHFEPGTLDTIRRVHAGEIGDPRVFSSVFGQHVAASNHRAKGGYWAGPVSDMGPYPINAVRNLFAAEPVEVHAVGFTTPGRNLGFHDTVSVTLRFPEERLAQFSVSYTGAEVNQYRVVGTKGDVEVAPAYLFGPGVAIAARARTGGDVQERRFPVTDQFGGETQYFSDCLLRGRDPEPDGEEGWLDVRILAAAERALETGRPQRLEPYERRQRPTAAQAVALPEVAPPALIAAKEPGEE